MRYDLVTYVLGWILLCLGGSMACPLIVAWWYKEPGSAFAFGVSILLVVVVGWVMTLVKPREGARGELSPREGFVIVSGGWMLSGLFGAIPFFLDGTFFTGQPEEFSLYLAFRSFTDSVFETVSGFTTTGASILTDFSRPSHSMFFWRSLTHWLGGMGIIVLSLAILPVIGVGGMQLFRAEVPGPVKDRLKPKISDTAKTLWMVYVLISLAEVILLWIGPMDLFEALCHTFGTMATGGFSTKGASVGEYNSSYVNWVITIFMLIAGANFALHYRFLTGDLKTYFKSEELRVYGIIVIVSLILVVGSLQYHHIATDYMVNSLGGHIEHGAFQVGSILTTTGYCSTDFEQWPHTARMLLFVLMIIGGCAGSTGGGAKVVRIVLVFKTGYREVLRLIRPKAVYLVRLDRRPVPEKVVAGVVGFIILYVGIATFSVLFLSILNMDFVTAMTATAASLSNIGPGLELIGPYDNYAWMPLIAKWWLCFLMILGRLEIYSVLVLLAPSFWRR
ncbi:MAG: potassium transporter TrkG [bacterium]